MSKGLQRYRVVRKLDERPKSIVGDDRVHGTILSYVQALRERKPALFRGGSLIAEIHYAIHKTDGGHTLTLALDDQSSGAVEFGTVQHLHLSGD